MEIPSSFGFTSLAALQDDVPATPSNPVVHDLLYRGHPRVNVLAARPEAGKSTLSAQMAVAVTQGGVFLGRQCDPGEVVYWGTEDSPADARRRFTALGYDVSRDKAIYLLTQRGKNPMDDLREMILAHPDVRLVILEPLVRLLHIKDIKDNSACEEAFDRLEEKVLLPCMAQCCFLGIVQLRKRHAIESADNSDAAQTILGGTEIAARTDAKIFLRRVSDDDPRRIVWATVRNGREIPKTYLAFDSITRRATLGMTVRESCKVEAQQSREAIQEQITRFLCDHPNSTEEQILDFVSGRSDTKRELLKQGVLNGSYQRNGRGCKGSPHTYAYNKIVAR